MSKKSGGNGTNNAARGRQICWYIFSTNLKLTVFTLTVRNSVKLTDTLK